MVIDDQSYFHVTWQCHNKDWLFQSNGMKQLYYDLLLRFKGRYQVQIYSYCFMSNHAHLTGYCENKKLFSDFFRIVNSLFARKLNQNRKRRGQVIMDRFKSPRIESHQDLEKVMQYVDLNPKRAGMVVHPKDYAWTSFHYYAYGKTDSLITPAPNYEKLGTTGSERQIKYLAMIEEILRSDWKEKRPYSSAPFVGNPIWVEVKTKQLRESISEKKKSWQKKFKEIFKRSG